jgi:hypothetical protein
MASVRDNKSQHGSVGTGVSGHPETPRDSYRARTAEQVDLHDNLTGAHIQFELPPQRGKLPFRRVCANAAIAIQAHNRPCLLHRRATSCGK